MQAQLDSTFLIALRLLVNEPNGAHAATMRKKLHLTPEDVTALSEFRRRYAALLSSDATQAEDEAAGLSLWRETWAFMETTFRANDEFALYVPPIYTSNHLQAMLQQIYGEFRQREVLHGTFPTGHPVISGIEGTGKTTIVKAVAIAAAICSPVMFLLYVSYEDASGMAKTQWSVPRLLRELLVRYGTANVDGEFGSLEVSSLVISATSTIPDVLDKLYSLFYLRVGIIADEIQEVVTLDMPTLAARVAIMAGLQSFARHGVNAFMVLTGSSSNLRQCLVREGRRRGYESFPDFNHDPLSLLYCLGSS